MSYPHGGAAVIFGTEGDGKNPRKSECGAWGAHLERSITGLEEKVSDAGQPFPLIRTNDTAVVNIQLSGRSIREHTIVWHPQKAKYYMMADVVDELSQHHPNTYETEIHLFSSVDLLDWTYHGVCIQKGLNGDIGEHGVATPAGAAYLNGKIYCPFSARNSATFTGRSIGLAWSGVDPEVIPWSRTATAVSNTSGEDDDPAVVAVDDTLHLYYRTNGSAAVPGYHIVHSQSTNPEDVSSWTAPAACTVNPEPGVTAQELTGALYQGGLVHLFIMEHQGGAVGTSHLASINPAASDFPQYASRRFVSAFPSNGVYHGHLGVVMRGAEVKAFSWTVDMDGTRYGVGLHPYDPQAKVIVGAEQPGAFLNGGDDDWFLLPHDDQLVFNGQFSLAFKCRVNGPLVDENDNYCLFYKGSDGNSSANEGTVAINFRGGTFNGIVARLTKADGSYLYMQPSEDLSEKIINQSVVVALTRSAQGLAQLWLVYDTSISLLAQAALPYADFGMALTDSGAIGAAYSGASSAAVPFSGVLSEAAFYNTELGDKDVLEFAATGVAPRHRYTPAGTGEFAGCRAHYVFSGALGERVPDNSGRAPDLEFQGGELPAALPRKTDLGAHLVRGANQSIPNSAFTQVNFDTSAEKQVGVMWDGSSLTIGVTGWYLVAMNARFAANASGIRAARLYKNGGIAWTPSNQDAVQDSGQITVIDAATPLFLEKGDVLDMRVFQSSGGALDLQTAAGTPFLKAVRLG